MPDAAALSRVAVMGAGVMGSRIAALFAAAEVPVLLLDLTADMAREGLARAEAGPRVTPASFDSGIPELLTCDWVLEAVSENLAVKRAIWARAVPFLSADAIASTNTSGISLATLAEGFPESFRRQFLGVHFFNPPSRLRLVELIRNPQTLPAASARATQFLTERLGRVVVQAKDTPNFVANRIGAYFSAAAQQLALAGNHAIEEVDALTGPLIGLPKSGTFRMMDVIGLDIWAQVMPKPLPPYFAEMLRRGLLGEKSGSGFYRKTTREGQRSFESLDLTTLEYRPAADIRISGSEIPDLPTRLRYLLARSDSPAQFLRPLLTGLFEHCHKIAPEIAYSNGDIDLAMHFGYGWTLGPFALKEALT